MNILMFPGQGSQKIGMGKDFNDNFSVARDIFKEEYFYKPKIMDQ